MNQVRGQFRHQAGRDDDGSCADKTLLLVEDSVTVAMVLREKLVARWHCKVEIVNSYKAAEQRLKEDPSRFYLAISDLNLPDAPNGEIIDLLKAFDVKTIAMTGTFGEETRSSVLGKGVVDYIIKNSINAYDYAIELVGRLFHNSSVKILVVDDAQIIRTILDHVLGQQNFQVLLASTGAEALAILAQNKDISVVITDYRMPDMDGHALTMAIRKEFDKSRLSIIGISAMGDDDLGIQFLKSGANDFLHKPFSNEELVCRINLNLDNLHYIATVENLANRDHLTKLYNRRCFFSLGGALFQAQNGLTQVAMLDIDHFKNVNDTYGHECGDIVLIMFAELLQSHFDDHIVARIGGEEFAIVFDKVDDTTVTNALTSFLTALQAQTVHYEEHSITITTSIGCHTSLLNSLNDALKAADKKLYIAKTNGRNQLISTDNA